MPHPDMPPLAVEFFARFSRFEHALKCFSAYRDGDDKRVDPNWDRFAGSSRIKPLFGALQNNDQANYLIENPPKKRILRGEILDWKDEPKPTDMVQLLLAMRRVRNNLFHGDKANPNLTRNTNLFNASLVVMDALLAADTDVRDAYEANIGIE